MCVKFNQGGWTTVIDQFYKAPYAYKGNQWMGYDDVTSLAVKVIFGQLISIVYNEKSCGFISIFRPNT